MKSKEAKTLAKIILLERDFPNCEEHLNDEETRERIYSLFYSVNDKYKNMKEQQQFVVVQGFCTLRKYLSLDFILSEIKVKPNLFFRPFLNLFWKEFLDFQETKENFDLAEYFFKKVENELGNERSPMSEKNINEVKRILDSDIQKVKKYLKKKKIGFID